MSEARRGVRRVVLAWLGLCVAVVAVAAPRVDVPGLYYDEAFLAQQARDFFQPERFVDHADSTSETYLFGRPVPLRNAVYLGSLKSQLLIPAFALFGADTTVLRLSTLAVGLLGLLGAMLLVRQLLGTAGAVASGVLLAADPSWLFFSLYEWGPFTSLLACRTLGLAALVSGWTQRRRGRLLVGAGLLGLGVYSRADFVVIGVACAGALAVCRFDVVRAAWRERRVDAVLALAMLTFASSPMWVTVLQLLATSGSGALAERGGLLEKAWVLWSVLDGSHYYRLMDWGGLFHRMYERSAPFSPFGILALSSIAGWCVHAGLSRRRDAPLGAGAFAAIASLGIAAAMFVMPGAVRAHHWLNLAPFPHMAVAAAGLALWRGRFSRVAVAALGGTVLLGNAWVVTRTYQLMEQTGGRGRFSLALHEVAAELEAEATFGGRGVSLDWGFHEPLLFLTERAVLLQPIWRASREARRGGVWVHRGRPGDLYLVHDAPYDLFGMGPAMLAEARSLAEQRPDEIAVREHRDREGGVSFHTIRIDRAHVLRVRRNQLAIELL